MIVAPGLNLRPPAPEAVWPEEVALQPDEVLEKQALRADFPGGPEAVNCVEPLGPEVLVLLELEEQLPELPVTPD